MSLVIFLFITPKLLSPGSERDLNKTPIARYLNAPENHDCKFCNMKQHYSQEYMPGVAPRPSGVIDLFDVPIFAAINRNKDSGNYIDKSNAIEDPDIIRLFKKIRPYTKKINKTLVRRVVPHGKKAINLEHDYKYKTFYKPLARVHGTKLIKGGIYDKIKDGGILNKLNSNYYKDMRNQKSENIVVKEIDNKEDLLELFQTNNKNKINSKVFTNKRKTIKPMDKKNSLKTYGNVFYLLKHILRSPQFEKSGEANDPLAPGNVKEFDEVEEKQSKTKVWMPHYPPWNYWTYRKPIHQDICPGMQVKIGNMCIWVPPH